MEKEIKLEEKCTTGAPKKKKMSRKRKKKLIFVAVLLAYPVIQFLATWILSILILLYYLLKKYLWKEMFHLQDLIILSMLSKEFLILI